MNSWNPLYCFQRRHRQLVIYLAIIVVICFLLLIIFNGGTGDTSDGPFGRFIYPKNVNHKLCIIVPYRNAFNELLEFVPHMDRFLKRQNVNYSMYVINQIDDFRFNRGALLNVGARLVLQDGECDYIALHDVDLLPLNDKLSYGYPGNDVVHLCPPYLHPFYNYYDYFLGGIIVISLKSFVKIDGMSNKYWGWGSEDDEFHTKLIDHNINIIRPQNIGTDKWNTFKNIHSVGRERDVTRCYNQFIENFKRDPASGLHSVQYKITKKVGLLIDEIPVQAYNVKLVCDRSTTPWCVCTKFTQFLRIWPIFDLTKGQAYNTT